MTVEDDAAGRRHKADGPLGDIVVALLDPLATGLARVLHHTEELPATHLDVGILGAHAHADLGLNVQRVMRRDIALPTLVNAALIGVQGVSKAREDAPLTHDAILGRRQEVGAYDHVLRGNGEHLAGRGRAKVVDREHQHAGLGLRLGREGHVSRHLVAVEVCVEGRTDERMQVDGLAVHEDGLEGLDRQAVQRRCAVQEHQTPLDDLVEDIPDLGGTSIDGALGGLDVVYLELADLLEVDEATHDEGLEELERHGGGQAALVQLERGVDDDDRAARVVDALAEQVLAETPLLTLEGLGERLQGAPATPRDGTAPAPVVKEGVHGLLQHALLVVDDDRGGVKVEQALEAVIAVDDAAVEVVEV